jgi:glycosyltransferase involved in cell wall biosynthesis
MNILQVGTAGIKIPPQKYGAIELYIYCLSKHMVRAGHNVTVLDVKESKSDPDIEYIDGIKFIRLHAKKTILSSRNFIIGYVKRRINTLFFTLKVGIYIKKGHVDIIHLHAILISFILVFLNRKLRRKMVYTVHSPAWFMSPVGRLDKLALAVECCLMRRVDKVIAQTAPLKDRLIAIGKIKPEKVVVLHTGAEINEFSPNIDTGDVRERYGLKGRITILFAGRIVPYKGVEYLAKAADIIVNDFGYKKALFLLIGPIAEHETDKAQYADYVAKIFSLIKDSGLEANVKLTGAVSYDDLTKLLSTGDIFVLPSLAESFPAIVSQAMASAKPVIGTRVGGIPDQIKDGWNGYLVEPMSINWRRR